VLTLSMGTAAMASGAEGGGNAEIGDAAAYNMGKLVYATKLNCSGCPMAGKSLDAAAAKQLLAGQPKVNLSADEAKALGVFLTRRFRM
jgi:Fe-S cluster biogenesis protein NfuA